MFISKRKYVLQQEELKTLKEKSECDEALISFLKLKLKTGETPFIVGSKHTMEYIENALKDLNDSK